MAEALTFRRTQERGLLFSFPPSLTIASTLNLEAVLGAAVTRAFKFSLMQWKISEDRKSRGKSLL